MRSRTVGAGVFTMTDEAVEPDDILLPTPHLEDVKLQKEGLSEDINGEKAVEYPYQERNALKFCLDVLSIDSEDQQGKF